MIVSARPLVTSTSAWSLMAHNCVKYEFHKGTDDRDENGTQGRQNRTNSGIRPDTKPVSGTGRRGRITCVLADLAKHTQTF